MPICLGLQFWWTKNPPYPKLLRVMSRTKDLGLDPILALVAHLDKVLIPTFDRY